jgi:hypothetical protein
LHGKGYKVNTIGVVEFILAAHLSKVRDLGFGKARIANPRQQWKLPRMVVFSGDKCPNLRSDLSALGIRALIGGTIASLFTAVIVGMLI